MDRQSLISLFDELSKIAGAGALVKAVGKTFKVPKVSFSGPIARAAPKKVLGLPSPASISSMRPLSDITKRRLPSPASLVRGNVIQGRVAPAPSVRMAA